MVRLPHYILIGFMLIFASICYCQKYSCIEISGTDDHIVNALSLAGLPLEDAAFDYTANTIKIIVAEKDMYNLETMGIKYQVAIADMQAWFKDRNDKSNFKKSAQVLPAGFQYGSLMGYPTFQEIILSLDTMFLMYPHLVKEKISIGSTLEGRDIYLIKLSNYSKTGSKKKVLFTSLHHAREAASVTTLLYYMFHILENYGKDPVTTFILDNRELYFLPVVNPDGYVYNEKTNPDGGGMWRKNRTPFEEGIGVDLNRNYSYKWESISINTGTHPLAETYRGTSAFSELETQSIKKLAEENEFVSVVNYHSFGNFLIYPWSYTSVRNDDIAQYRYIARKIAAKNNYGHGNTTQLLGYLAVGTFEDWLYGDTVVKNRSFSYTCEVGSFTDYFWPVAERIEPIAQENIFTNNYIALSSSSLVDSVINTAPAEYVIGDTAAAELRFFNEGVVDADSIVVVIKTEDNYLDIISNLYIIHDIKSFNLSDSIIFNFTFKNTTPLNHIAKYTIETNYDGLPFKKDFFIQRVRSENFDYENVTVESGHNTIALAWSTLTENNCSGFEVERKYQNGNFETIAYIEPKGINGAAYVYNDYPKISGVYTYRIKAIVDQIIKYSREVYIDYKYLPVRYDLSQNYPNPANPATTIKFSLQQDTKAALTIYNILGERVMTVFDTYFTAGNHSILLDLKHLPSQIYFYELKTPDFKMIKRMLILK